VQKLSKFGNFKNQLPLTQKLQQGPMHIIHQIVSTLQALSDGKAHFLKKSKFVDILKVKISEIVKIWKFQQLIAINIETSARTHAYYTSNCIYSSSSFRWWRLVSQIVKICLHFRGKNVRIVKIWKFKKINSHQHRNFSEDPYIWYIKLHLIFTLFLMAKDIFLDRLNLLTFTC
jgi:hypothetical protein